MRGKIAVVTGGSSGIGLAIINQLNAAGITAVSWDINLAPTINYVNCDVTSEEKVKLAFEATIKNLV